MSYDLINVETAMKITKEEVVDNYKKYINPSLAKMLGLLNFDKQFVKANGVRVWDSEGNEYLDFLGGYGALNLGHNPPEVHEALEKVKEMPNLLQASMGTMASVAARNLSKLTPGKLTHTFFSNSGTEAVEGAIKLARIASGKKKIIYCKNSFHGKSMGSLSITGREKYQKLFKPLVPETESVPFGDVKSLEEKFKEGDIAGFIVEPIQGEGGINLPPDGYFKKVRELCDEYGVYLILDEIQTGFGRTGKIFACEHEGIVPDIMCLAKSLGGGVMPIGAYTTTEEIWSKAYGSMDKALLHTSTFGGNTLATAAAIAAMEQIVEQKLSQQAAEKGEYFINRLKELADKYDLIKEVRGRGLMIGIEFKQPESGLLDKISQGMVSKFSHEYLGSMVAGALYNDYRIITAYTLNNPNVIRMEPPLIVTREEIDTVIGALEDIFSKNKGLFGFTVNSAKKVLSGFFKK
ncbi:aspartate aminotransferase family protein [Halothermothrix orenii]|uniref:Ornithine aminotransferase n=1 Tax=Halothermothrix orenii (strain H 168 / OCM 544 / DSM 9562) TaxID=373903 RepID=B8CYV2_HALOH|nr:aspartate aminotransferase family protein [Halothermothrix orenii]ACL70471.1 ornithine aminotransferase [Halothermothrix orenii H 168]